MTTKTTTTTETTSVLDLNLLDRARLQAILFEALTSPEEVQNDAGRIENHELDKVVKALKYAEKLQAAQQSPFGCLQSAPIHYRDAWR